jgi:hypothetical protein
MWKPISVSFSKGVNNFPIYNVNLGKWFYLLGFLEAKTSSVFLPIVTLALEKWLANDTY